MAGNGDHGRLGLGGEGGCVNLRRVTAVGAAARPNDAHAHASASAAFAAAACRVACGGAHTAYIDAEGALWTFGMESSLGRKGGPVPARVPLPAAAVAVSAGHHHTLVVLDDGSLWAFGDNSEGQLGVGAAARDRAATPRPVEALGGERVVSVAAGGSHSLAATATGAVFAFGARRDGALGLGSPPGALRGLAARFLGARVAEDAQRYPAHVPGTGAGQPEASDGVQFCAAAVYAGHNHSAARTSRGAVYTWGRGRDYQLGHGEARGAQSSGRPRRIAQPEDGSGGAMGPIVGLALGSYHTLLVGGGGALFAAGSNEHGCLGTGDKPGWAHGAPARCAESDDNGGALRVVGASAGWKHSATVDDQGRLFTWGWGGSSGATDAFYSSGGQLARGSDRDRWEAREVKLGDDEHRRDHPRALAVSCGFNHTAVIVAGREAALVALDDAPSVV